MNRLRWYLLLIAFAMSVPAILAVTVFPTAMIDTREVFAWGRFFPLTTPKHPPLMALIAGLVELGLPPTALSAIIVGQIINAIGIYYLYATLRMLVDRDRALLFTFLFATSIYFIVAPLSYALNADILQIPIWLGILYHFVRAEEGNRLSHWVALAVWSAAAILNKYTAGVLFLAMAIGTLASPSYRSVWRNGRFYLAMLITLALLVPYFMALRSNASALVYAEQPFIFDASLLSRFENIGKLFGGTIFYLVPGVIILAVGIVRGDFRLSQSSDLLNPKTEQFLTATASAAGLILVLIIIAMGLDYRPRFTAPFFAMLILAVAPRITLDSVSWSRTERRILWTTGLLAATILVVATGIYLKFGHSYMQEPTADAAAIIRSEWQKKFTCGPAYFLGDRPSAHGLAISGDRHAVGVPVEDIPLVNWFDPALLEREGAVVVYRKHLNRAELAAYLPRVPIEDVKSFTLPLRRTFASGGLTYEYFFIPPGGCGTAQLDAGSDIAQ